MANRERRHFPRNEPTSEDRNQYEIWHSMANRSSDSRPDHWVSFVPLTNVDGESFPRHMRMLIDMDAVDLAEAEAHRNGGAIFRNSRRIFSAMIREARRERHIRRH
jgi:hypothetical protein